MHALKYFHFEKAFLVLLNTLNALYSMRFYFQSNTWLLFCLLLHNYHGVTFYGASRSSIRFSRYICSWWTSHGQHKPCSTQLCQCISMILSLFHLFLFPNIYKQRYHYVAKFYSLDKVLIKFLFT